MRGCVRTSRLGPDARLRQSIGGCRAQARGSTPPRRRPPAASRRPYRLSDAAHSQVNLGGVAEFRDANSARRGPGFPKRGSIGAGFCAGFEAIFSRPRAQRGFGRVGLRAHVDATRHLRRAMAADVCRGGQPFAFGDVGETTMPQVAQREMTAVSQAVSRKRMRGSTSGETTDCQCRRTRSTTRARRFRLKGRSTGWCLTCSELRSGAASGAMPLARRRS